MRVGDVWTRITSQGRAVVCQIDVSNMTNPTFLVASVVSGLSDAVSEPWPEDSALFQPYESKVPFVKAGAVLAADFLPIVELVSKKGTSLSDYLTDSERADMYAYISLIDNNLLNAEIFVCWMHEPTLNEVTIPRCGTVYAWPLSVIIPYIKQRQQLRHLRSLKWNDKKLHQVLELVNLTCKAISTRLGENEFFFGDKPTELDALLFGHIFTILTTELPDIDLASIIRRYPNLPAFCQRIEKTYFFSSNDH